MMKVGFFILMSALGLAAVNLGTCEAQQAVTTPGGVKIEVIQQGSGPVPTKGQTVSVHYIGKLTNGKTFDSSRERGEPIKFPIGMGQVIKGWDEAVGMMKIGTRAMITIPPEMGYGSRGSGGVIPPNAVLIFDVELLKAQ
ncbi:MAG: FKBP-type peptidyl-prolyl cis-trans isomerase [Pseudomonadota bacterium]|jgi:peptidylprolyl isomerase